MRRAVIWLAAVSIVGLAAIPLILTWRKGYVPVDLQVYMGAGAAVRNGSPLYAHSLTDVAGATGQFTYPPFAALPFVAISLLDLTIASVTWCLLSVAALTTLVAISFRSLVSRLPQEYRPLAVAALTAAGLLTIPMTNHLFFAQVGVFLVLACVLDVCIVPSRFQGVLIGVASAFKLTSAVFIVWFVLTRQWRAAATSLATLAGAWALAAVLLPADSNRYFGGGLFADTGRIVKDVAFVDNQSLLGVTRRLDLPDVVWAVLAVAVMAFGLSRAAKARRLGQPLAAATLVGVTSLLASPVSWIHHALWLVPAAGTLVDAGRQRGRIIATLALWGGACLMPVNQLGPGSVDPLAGPTSGWLWPLREGFVLIYLAIVFLLPLSAEAGDRSLARTRTD